MACSHLSKLVQDLTDSVGMYIYKEGGESNEKGLLVNCNVKLLKHGIRALYPSPSFIRTILIAKLPPKGREQP